MQVMSDRLETARGGLLRLLLLRDGSLSTDPRGQVLLRLAGIQHRSLGHLGAIVRSIPSRGIHLYSRLCADCIVVGQTFGVIAQDFKDLTVRCIPSDAFMNHALQLCAQRFQPIHH